MTAVRTSVTEWVLSPGNPTAWCRCTECGTLTCQSVWKFWDADVATIIICLSCVDTLASEGWQHMKALAT